MWRALAVVGLALTACASFPVDPEGTLDRVRGGVLRVGLTPNEPWTSFDDTPSGIEVELAKDFAESIGSEVEWSTDSEEDLFKALEQGKLDLVLGGFTSQNPYAAHAALTRPYYDDRVMALRMGENAFMVELETYLLEQRGRIEALVAGDVRS